MKPESDKSIVQFGRFTVLPLRRELLAEGVPVELGGRAFDLLIALIEARGTVLSKEELISRAWPGRVVEDNNLQVQIAALRKVFSGEHELIRTVAGRGYQFTGEIRSGTEPPAATRPATNLSKPVTELIGRNAELKEVLQLAADHRLVTLTGVGGIGKTRLGLEAAQHLLPRFADGIWLSELGPLSNPEVVPVTVATALGLTLSAGSMTPEHVATALGSKKVLLVLDNCEHVIEAAARMAEVLLRSTPSACVLATSREPLRAPGEYVYRVPPLEVPTAEQHGREDLMKTGSVKLFMARARDAEPQFSPDKRVAAIAAICRQLDGIPLAIELAAARTSALGVEGLAARLDDRFKLLTGGRRTALPRHQTLLATLDWSYELLPATERVVLRRLAVFAGSCTLEAASAVTAGGAITESDVFDYVTNLVAKSLVTADAGRAVMHYRLLETTRAYAMEKLNESSEFAEFARRHAEYHRDLFERAEAEWETQPTVDWLASYGRQIDNVRTALDWAFSPAGDAEIGVALTVAAVPLWMHLSLIVECRARAEHALAVVESGLSLEARREMHLHAALAWSLMYTAGPVRETGAAWTNAIEMAERLNDAEYQLRALWGLWIYHLSTGESRATLAVAQRFCSLAVAKASPAEVLVGERMVGVSLHYMGDQIGAREHLERVLGNYVAPVHRSHAIRFQFDQRVSARATLVRVLWLQGLPQQAAHAAEIAIADARRIDHALSLALALEAACLLDLFLGDLEAAERSMAVLLDHATRNAIGRWHAWGRCFEGVLRASRGDFDAGLQLLRAGLDDLRKTRFALFYIKFLGELANALARAGQIAQGIEAIDEALARSERNDERWCMAELLRIKGELVLMAGASDAAAQAERCFVESLDWARKQGALSWELRSATSLARLWHTQRRTDKARDLLAPMYGKFSEGFETADLKSAKVLLDSLR
ncbi:MAG TPA: winged helix-turn-helix domain-containing protein [Burkholderiales bacterium]|nr:winged helix-turn-helix domain-containing protein [Burkholderiales bacterium]